MSGRVLGYVNVYRDTDGEIELGSTDLYPTRDDEMMLLLGESLEGVVEHIGIAEVRLLEGKG